MLLTIVICGIGYVYARRKYKTSPALQALVKKGRDYYDHCRRPSIEILEYSDGYGVVRSRSSKMGEWSYWQINKEDYISIACVMMRYPLSICKDIAEGVVEYYVREKIQHTVINTSVIRP